MLPPASTLCFPLPAFGNRIMGLMKNTRVEMTAFQTAVTEFRTRRRNSIFSGVCTGSQCLLLIKGNCPVHPKHPRPPDEGPCYSQLVLLQLRLLINYITPTNWPRTWIKQKAKAGRILYHGQVQVFLSFRSFVAALIPRHQTLDSSNSKSSALPGPILLHWEHIYAHIHR